MSKGILRAATALALAIGAPAFAADPVPASTDSGTVYRLIPEEVDAAVADASRHGDALLPELPGANRIHGMVGAMIGTGGTRGIFGAADIPVSDSVIVSVAVESARSSWRRRD